MLLIVGGAGYIGSHVNRMLNQKGYQTIVLDNLSRGSRESVTQGIFIEGDMADTKLLDSLFQKYPITGVMHFAALTDVGESIIDPLKYYVNNVSNTITLLNAMVKHKVKYFIFSSSAAVYGSPACDKITETAPCHPINPYGETKLMVEKILRDVDQAYGIKSICLRYFNAAGGDPAGQVKNFNCRRKEANLIPVVLKSLKQKTQITINGNDYPTKDGTCVRDYIHIDDLGNAHILAMERLQTGDPSNIFNLGNGQGFSIHEVINTAEQVTGLKVNAAMGPRRPGDPAILLADASKAERELGWKQRYSSLEQMIAHAWQAMVQI